MTLVYPPQEIYGSTSWEEYENPTRSYPNYLESYIDPLNGLKVTRVSDEVAFGITDRFQRLRHQYSKRAVWNADGSLIMLTGNNGKLLNGNTFEIVHQFGSGWTWANQTPNKIFFSYDKTFSVATLNLTTFAVSITQTRTFPDYAVMNLQTNENNLSNDDKYVCLYGYKTGSSDSWVVVYNILEDIIVSEVNVGIDRSRIDYYTMSQSGLYVLIRISDPGPVLDKGMHVFNVDSTMSHRSQISTGAQHGEVSLDTNGEDVYVSWFQQVSGYSLSMVKLSDGTAKGLLPKSNSWNGIGIGGIHLSSRNLQRPGWIYATINNTSNPETARPSIQIMSIKLDESQTIEKWCWTNTRDPAYYHQAHGCVSPDGKQVLFASDQANPTEMAKPYARVFVARKENNNLIPRITRTDSNPTTITQGGTYIPPTGTWTDEVDGTGAATVAGDVVNVNVVGSYTVRLQYSNTSDVIGYLDIVYTVVDAGENIIYPLTELQRLQGKVSIIKMIKKRII
jgi:hypothetical protein